MVFFPPISEEVVGGSYKESESQLSQLALRWMLCEAELAGLRVDPHRKAAILGGKLPYVAPDPATRNQHESLHGLWWIAELWPKIVNEKTPQGTWKKSFRINFGRRRWIPPDSLVHESVEQRLAAPTLSYRPSNLPQQRRIIGDRCAN